MGVHDYACFLHSRPLKQCLTTYEANIDKDIFECIKEIIGDDGDGDDILVKYFESRQHDPYKYIIPLNILDDKFVLSVSEENGFGDIGAYLFIYDENSQRLLEIINDNYSWDKWDFERYTGYGDVLSAYYLDDASVWQRDNKIIKNVCTMCYNFFFQEVDVVSIPSRFFYDVSKTLNIPLSTNIKEVEYNKLRKTVYQALNYTIS